MSLLEGISSRGRVRSRLLFLHLVRSQKYMVMADLTLYGIKYSDRDGFCVKMTKHIKVECHMIREV